MDDVGGKGARTHAQRGVMTQMRFAPLWRFRRRTTGYDPLVPSSSTFTSITPAPAFPHVPVILQL